MSAANPSPARRSLVWRLVRKDWHFNRWPILAYTAVGILALLALSLGGEGGFSVGSIALITVLICIGVHLIMITVVHERRDQTLAFVMTLPISAREYTVAKVLANLLIFGTAWSILVVGTVAAIASRSAVPDGLIPFALSVLGEILASYCLLLAVALVSESMPWTIGAIVFGNLAVQGVIYLVSHAPGVAKDFSTDAIVWRRPVVEALLIEGAVVAGCVLLTFAMQERKTDFV